MISISLSTMFCTSATSMRLSLLPLVRWTIMAVKIRPEAVESDELFGRLLTNVASIRANRSLSNILSKLSSHAYGSRQEVEV